MKQEDLAKAIENIVIKYTVKDGEKSDVMVDNLNDSLDVLTQVLIAQIVKRMAVEKKFIKTTRNEILETVKNFMVGGTYEYFDHIYDQVREIAEKTHGNVLSIV